ncbi:hypothetical protein KP79_PYT25993 [Mizuhopecten yessoensis]|uniref:Uncharacterized protein n=1 Tax=Mizuhopecten yessoensis TaxID=6573 RepID=A0A210PJS3_MIZYE|nr:hypothetical protein KP79_PYT25993 [Mizuhopecten yessoensis]
MGTSTPSAHHGNVLPGNYYPQTVGYPPGHAPSPQAYNVNLSPDNIKDIAVAVRDMLVEEISSLIQKEMAPLRVELDAIKLENQDLRLKLDDLEQYSRRPLVRISGIPESQHENSTALVLDVIDKAGISVSAEDIERTHRVGNPVKTRSKPRQIIMRLRSYEAKRTFLKSSKKFRDCPATKSVSVNEDLTKHRDKLAFHCRKLVKNPSSSVVQTWTWDGKVMVKDKSDRTSRSQRRRTCVGLVMS